MKPYTHVVLTSGESACIVDVLEDGVAYLADVDHQDGSTSTEFVKHGDIERVTDCPSTTQ